MLQELYLNRAVIASSTTYASYAKKLSISPSEHPNITGVPTEAPPVVTTSTYSSYTPSVSEQLASIANAASNSSNDIPVQIGYGLGPGAYELPTLSCDSKNISMNSLVQRGLPVETVKQLLEMRGFLHKYVSKITLIIFCIYLLFFLNFYSSVFI